MLIAPKRLKLGTSDMTRMFPVTVQISFLTIFSKWGVCKNSLGGDIHSHERLRYNYLYNYTSFVTQYRKIVFTPIVRI